jgi:2'-5' RNA ligase
VQAQLAQLLLEVQRAIGDAAAALRWTPAVNVHLTLHFLGELDPSRAANVVDRLGDAIDVAPFEATVGSVGTLPPSGTPRIVWAGVTHGVEELQRMHAILGERLREAGVATETRPFLPHLTLARVRDRERSRARTVRDRLDGFAAPSIPWSVDHVTLFKSDLSGPVPRYEAVSGLRCRG